MKIDQSNLLAAFNAGSRGQGHKSEVSFTGYLNQALENQTISQPAQLVPPLSFTMPVAPGRPASLEPVHREGVEKAENLLACLEEYRSLLGDSAKSLKDVGAAMDKLEDQLRQLAPVMERLDEKDPLSQMLQSAAGLALVETIKYRRGDYI